MANGTVVTESPNGFSDRKTGLVVFGALTAIFGGLCGLLAVYLRIEPVIPTGYGAPPEIRRLLPDALSLGLWAVALFWLGIGSVLARRWARALLLIFSWWLLTMGVVTVGIQVVVLPPMMHVMDEVKADFESFHSDPAGPRFPALLDSRVILMTMIFSGIVFVILPIVWALFYRSKHVKATCEARDPIPRWTDRCPLPVIAACIWLVFSSATTLWEAVTDKSPMPFFGMFITGPVTPVLDALLALIWAYSAWALHRLRWRGWWTVVVAIVAITSSVFLTYRRHDTSEVLGLTASAEVVQRALQHPDPELAKRLNEIAAKGHPAPDFGQTLKEPFLHDHEIAWYSLCGTLPLLGYLMYLRRFFPRASSS